MPVPGICNLPRQNRAPGRANLFGDGIFPEDLTEAADTIDRLTAERDAARAENKRLREALNGDSND